MGRNQAKGISGEFPEVTGQRRRREVAGVGGSGGFVDLGSQNAAPADFGEAEVEAADAGAEIDEGER
jgi:hypothetical protein